MDRASQAHESLFEYSRLARFVAPVRRGGWASSRFQSARLKAGATETKNGFSCRLRRKSAWPLLFFLQGNQIVAEVLDSFLNDGLVVIVHVLEDAAPGGHVGRTV